MICPTCPNDDLTTNVMALGGPAARVAGLFRIHAPNARGSVVPFTPAGNARGYITRRRID